MNKSLLLRLCFVIFIFSSISCHSSYNPENKFTPIQLREDFQVFRQSLEEGQPGLYRYITKQDLDRLFTETEQSLNQPLDVNEFYRVLAPLVANVKCGHTNISLPDFIKEQNGTRVPSFPVLVKIIKGKIFVWRDLTSKNGSLAGKEIKYINKIPASQIISEMLAATGSDGNIQTSKIKRIEDWNFIEKLSPIVDLQSPYDLTLSSSKSGDDEQVHLDGIDVPTLYENWKTWFPQDQRANRSGELKFVDNGNIAQMTTREFGGFVDDGQKQGLDSFYQDSFQKIAANNSKVLILDLRNNGGGDDKLGHLLLSYLLNEPFEHFKNVFANKSFFIFGKGLLGTTVVWLPYQTEKRIDDIYHITNYPNSGVQQLSTPSFTGKVYVLMNGGSFSTTAEVISQLHFHRRAEFIGEEVGGAYNGNNSGTMAQVSLPNTKLTLLVPLMSFYLSAESKDNSRGVTPNYPVDYSIDDYATNSNKEMKLALELVRQKPS